MYRKESNGIVKHLDFVILDLVCLQAAFLLSYLLFNRSGTSNPYGSYLYRNLSGFIEIINFMVLLFNNSLKSVLKRGYYREFLSTVKHSVFVIALSVLILFLCKIAEKYSRLILTGTFLIYTVITYVARVFWKRLIMYRNQNNGTRQLLIITYSSEAADVVRNILQNNFGGFRIAGLITPDENRIGKKFAGVPIVASIESAADYVCRNWIDDVLIVGSADNELPDTLIEELIETGVPVHINIAQLVHYSGQKQIVEKIGNYTVLTTSMNYASLSQLMVKRIFDIIAGILGCIATAVICIFIAPCICISSPGPIFFSQERVGKNGKKFKMYKFRSMYMDAEERKKELMEQNKVSDGKMFKLDFDPRVIGNRILPDGTKKTGIGQFIRNTSLDEFPQFWNVLKGDMSVVGTRPPLPGEVSLYEHRHRARLAIKPGITGMWQVSGRSDITEFEEVVELDKTYINNWDIGMDLKIILKTIAVVFKRDGSV